MGEGSKRKARQEELPAPPSHGILTSDELGLLKATEVPSGSKWEETTAKQRYGQPDKQQGITRLQLYCPDWESAPERCLIAAARASGRVTLHAVCTTATTTSTAAATEGPDGAGEESGAGGGGAMWAADVASFRAAPPASTSGRTDTSLNELRGLRFSRVEGQHQLLIVSGTAGGHVAVHRCGTGGEAALSGAAAAGVTTWQEAVRLQTVNDLQAMDVSSSGRYVAVGGEGHQLKVWDLNATSALPPSAGQGPGAGEAAAGAGSGGPLFAGKAGKSSRSGLQDLAHVTAVSYMPGQGDQLILVGTAKHKLWLYDMRAGRKPQSELLWGEGRITALAPQRDGLRLWVGNGRGQIEALDLRQAPSRLVMGHALKGSAGSIRSLDLHPTEPLIASVSLDRHLRLHSTTKRALLAKVYLKQALTGVAWLPVPRPPPAAEANDGDEEREDEDEGSEEELTARKGSNSRRRGGKGDGKQRRGSEQGDRSHKSSSKSQKRRKREKPEGAAAR